MSSNLIHRYIPKKLGTSELENFFNKNFSSSDLTNYNVKDLRAYIAKLSEQAHHITICDESTGNFIGLLSYYLNEKSCFITWFAIDVDFRSLGLGKLLMSDLETTLKSKDITTITLEVTANNTRAIYFYESLNFKLQGIDYNFDILKYSKNIQS